VTFVWITARKDLARYFRDPAALLLWFGIPVAIALIIQLAFGGRSAKAPQAHLLVADQDSTIASRLLTGSFGQGELATMIRTEPVTEAEGRRRMEKGRASALLVIPKGFADSLLAEKPDTLRLVTNPAQTVLPGIVEESLSILVDATFYLQRLLGDQVRRVTAGRDTAAGPPPDALVADVSVTVNRLARSLESRLFPPAIRLEVKAPAKAGPDVNFGTLLYPSILFMSLLFMAQGLSGDVWDERTMGTLRRFVTTPRAVSTLLAGKLLAGVLLVATIALLANVVGILLFGIPVRTLPLSVLWCAFSGTVFVLLLLALQVLASSQQTAGLLTSMVIFPLMMIGGSFFPFEAMPEFLSRIGKRTPNGWALEQLKAILEERVEPAALLVAFLALTVAGAALFLFVSRRLARGFAQA
jgi:ABC-type multidrug transport system permease subunit